MTFEDIVATLTEIAKAWRIEEAQAVRTGKPDIARDCRLRASAVEWALEVLRQKQKGH